MDERLKPYEEKMQKSYDYLEGDLATIRAGRANPHVLDKLKVDYYGTPTPIQQVGNITVPEARKANPRTGKQSAEGAKSVALVRCHHCCRCLFRVECHGFQMRCGRVGIPARGRRKSHRRQLVCILRTGAKPR